MRRAVEKYLEDPLAEEFLRAMHPEQSGSIRRCVGPSLTVRITSCCC
jgi:hypothetical protein